MSRFSPVSEPSIIRQATPATVRLPESSEPAARPSPQPSDAQKKRRTFTGVIGAACMYPLRAIIDAKVAGEEVVAPKEEAAPKVIDLMEALRRSLDQVSAGRKPTAKVEETQAAPAAKKAAAKAPKLVAAKPAAKKRKAS